MSNINKFNFRLFLLTIFFTLIFHLNSSFPQTFWTQTNGPLGGSVYSICSDSSHNLYAACRDLYKSTDDGETWNKLNIPNRNMYSIIYHANGSLFAASSDGQIFRSLSGGNDWQLVFSTVIGGIRLLVHNTGNIFALHSWYGIYRSTNNGENWIRVLEDDGICSIGKLSNGNLFAGKIFGGLLRSTNNGDNWINIAFNGEIIYSIAGNSQNQLFVCTEDSLFRSPDNGLSWVAAFYGLTPDDYMYIFTGNDDLLCSNRYGLFLSSNNGNNWSKITNEIGDDKIISFCHTSNGNLFTGGEGKGVYRTTNNGLNWSLENNGLKNSTIQSLFCYSPDIVITGAKQNGLFYSTNSGINWFPSNIQNSNEIADYYAIAMDNFGKLLAGVSGKFYNSFDSGKTWYYLSVLSNYQIEHIICNSMNHIFVSGSGYGMKKSTNGGINWTSISWGGYSGLLGRNFNGDMYSSSYQILHRSTNEGNSWNTICTLNFIPKCIEFDVNNNIYLGTWNCIYKSTDNGLNWIEIFNRNIFSNFKKIISASNLMYAMAEDFNLGIYYSTNYGNNWFLLTSGLENYSTNSFDRSTSGDLFCGTLWGGVFKGSEDVISVNINNNQISKTFYLAQNYPNPFNPDTKIQFNVPYKSHVKLIVYDLTGREIVVLTEKEYLPGTFVLKWDADTYSSGIYFCKMLGPGIEKTIKMILLR